MTVSTLLRLWKKAGVEYSKQSKNLLKRIIKNLNETKPKGEELEVLLELIGKSLDCSLN